VSVPDALASATIDPVDSFIPCLAISCRAFAAYN